MATEIEPAWKERFWAGSLLAAGGAGTEPQQRFPRHVPGNPERARKQPESKGSGGRQSPRESRSAHQPAHLRNREADDPENHCDGEERVVIECLQRIPRDRRMQGSRCTTARAIETGHRPERAAGKERRGVRIDKADIGASRGGETGESPIDRSRRNGGSDRCRQRRGRRRRNCALRRWNHVRLIHGQSLWV
jgi:hypothetical protein